MLFSIKQGVKGNVAANSFHFIYKRDGYCLKLKGEQVNNAAWSFYCFCFILVMILKGGFNENDSIKEEHSGLKQHSVRHTVFITMCKGKSCN